MTPSALLIFLAVGLLAGFVDAIAGGGGLITLPSLQLAGLDPVAAVATNKLAGPFGSGSATYAFWRAGRIHWPSMGPPAALAAAGSVLGALALPYAPRVALIATMPLLLIGVALYFAFAPSLNQPAPRSAESGSACSRRRRSSDFTTACLAPAPAPFT